MKSTTSRKKNASQAKKVPYGLQQKYHFVKKVPVIEKISQQKYPCK